MKVFILTRKRLMILSAALIFVCGVGIFKLAGGDETVAASTTQRSIPIYCVQTEEKKVAISFDAAWGNEQTQTLLDILDEYNIKSTFFLVGDWVRNYPDDVKAIAAAGHDIGNHSDTHPYMTQLDVGSIKSEIETCNSEVEALTGKAPTLFRPPYGDYDNNVVDTVNSLGMYCIQWDVDSLDWKNLSAEEMCSRIKNNIKCGSIILMHNGAENTPGALPMIIECIQELGYEIVPISELLPAGQYTTDHTGMMIPSTSDSSKNTSSAQNDSDSEKAKQTAAEIDEAVNAADDTVVSSIEDIDNIDNIDNAQDIDDTEVNDTTSTLSSTGLKGELSDLSSLNSKK